MVFYLGRDVDVYISTEQAGSAVTVSGAGNGPYIDVRGVAGAITITDAGGYADSGLPTITVGGGDGVAGVGTITLTGNPAVDENILLTDAGGTSKTYTAKAVEDTTANQFTQASGAAADATSLADCIRSAAGHNGTILVADDSAGVLSLGQATAGTDGNTTITFPASGALTNGSAVSFAGASDTAVAITLTAVTGGTGPGTGDVASVTVTNSGSGYRSAPILLFSSGTAGDTATATMTVSGGRDAYTLFADGLNWGASGTARVTDLTGCDLGIGAVDEDITYMGLRSITKGEIKKETTLSLTRKKPDAVWDMIWNSSWRCGVSGTSSAWSDLEGPKTDKGYRVYVQMKEGTEVFSIPNTYISAHTISLNADGTAEETMEFATYVTPTVSTSAHTGATSAANL